MIAGDEMSLRRLHAQLDRMLTQGPQPDGYFSSEWQYNDGNHSMSVHISGPGDNASR